MKVFFTAACATLREINQNIKSALYWICLKIQYVVIKISVSSVMFSMNWNHKMNVTGNISNVAYKAFIPDATPMQRKNIFITYQIKKRIC